MKDVPYPHYSGLGKRLFTLKQFTAYAVRTLQRRPYCMPDIFKRRILRSYLRRFSLSTLVETGTYLGETVEALRAYCNMIHSIEIQESFCDLARARFASSPSIKIWLGNSTAVLPFVLKEIHEPALFWLDGHFPSKTREAKTVPCPVLEELAIIYGHRQDHVVLIDDAREFSGEDGYPTIAQLKVSVAPFGQLSVHNDIVRIHR